MGSAQSLITIGALMLLTFAIFNMNRNLTETDLTLAQNRYRLEALSIMNSYIEQSTIKFFDESTLDTSSSKLKNNFSTSAHLGLDGNDGGVIDDFDDYHGLTIADTGRSGVLYNLDFKVEYVDLSGNRFVQSTNRTYHKRMTVSIYDAYSTPLIYRYKNQTQVKDTLTLSFVYSYWFYN